VIDWMSVFKHTGIFCIGNRYFMPSLSSSTHLLQALDIALGFAGFFVSGVCALILTKADIYT